MFPIGIDSGKFRQLEIPSCKQHINNIQKHYKGKKILLGIDRVDVAKGIPEKLLSFEKFLKENPTMHNEVFLVQIGVPTRLDVPAYQELNNRVLTITGHIRSVFGTLRDSNIDYLMLPLSVHCVME